MGRNSRDKNPDEHLRGKLRQALSEIKHLKKQLERAYKEIKRAHALNDIVDTQGLPEDPIQVVNSYDPDRCPKCRKKINTVDLGVRTVVSCSNKECSYRKVLINSGSR